jgi:hypothetical protein
MKVFNQLLALVFVSGLAFRLQAGSSSDVTIDDLCSTSIIVDVRQSRNVDTAVLAALQQWSKKPFTLYDKGAPRKKPETLSETARGVYEFRFMGVLNDKMRVVVFRDIGSVGTTTRILLVTKSGSQWRVTGEVSVGADIYTLQDLRSVLRCKGSGDFSRPRGWRQREQCDAGLCARGPGG